MGKRDREKHTGGAFVMVLLATLDCPAWRAMSHGARSLYIALKRRYGQRIQNNGRLFLSQRNAADELGSHPGQIARWYRELQYYGFIVMTTPHSLGVDGKGKAPHWRLTELGYMGEFPTRDYEKWNGEKFGGRNRRQFGIRDLESRAVKPLQCVAESQHSGVAESRTPSDQSVAESQHIEAATGVAESQHISRLATPLAKPVAVTVTPQLLELERRRALRAHKSAQASARVRAGGR